MKVVVHVTFHDDEKIEENKEKFIKKMDFEVTNLLRWVRLGILSGMLEESKIEEAKKMTGIKSVEQNQKRYHFKGELNNDT